MDAPLDAAGGSDAPDVALPFLRRAGGLEQRLVVLMGARLLLAFVSLGVALALHTTVGDVEEPGARGLYGTVAFAFLATAVYGLLLPRIRRPTRFAAINIAADIAIVTALVHFSGGHDSVFAFLYLLVAVYGALLFERPGALMTAALGGGSYGAVLLASRALAAGGGGASAAQPLTVTLAVWSIHAGAIVLVAALASFLAAELRRTGEALRQRTSALRHLADLHRRTVESLMSGLLTTDIEGRITSFNPEAERITGVRGAQALGLDVEQVLPNVRDPALRQAGRHGTSPRVRISYQDAQGRSLYLGVGAYVLREADGSPSGNVVIFQDVTDVVQMEAELRRSERLAGIGELSASIAHEIRNPLAAISGSIQMLQRHAAAAGGQGEAERLMDIVLREADRLNQLITDFLQYARPAPLRPEPVALEEAVSDLLEIQGAVVPDVVKLELALEPGVAVHADPAHLRQLLWNLVLNACQAMPEGGRLEVSAQGVSDPASQDTHSTRRNGSQGPEAWVEIAVRDQGVGIAAEALERIFDPFFTTRSGGSGLGLATVHRIVQEHGGSIRVESSVGSGTVVRVRLPRSEVTS